MAKLVDLVLDRYDGSLKAEHGTGVNMAPFVEREWGPTATELMWRIKELADPDRRPRSRASSSTATRTATCANLKTTPPIEEVATTCVECGFCEPVCPSRDLTTTPRQRIVLRREMARQPAGSPLLANAARGVRVRRRSRPARPTACCAHACPLGIDTGKLVKELRAREHGRARGARRAAGRAALGPRRGAAPAPAWRRRRRSRGRSATRPLRARHRRRPAASAPSWSPAGSAPMPPPRRPALPPTVRDGAAAVYLPACVNRIFGRDPALPTPTTRRAAVAAGGARRRLAPRRPAALDPGRGRGHLLRDAVDLEGLPARRRVDGQRRPSTTSGAGADGGRAAGRGRRDLLHARACSRRRRSSSEADAERLAAMRDLDSIAWARDLAAGS